MSKMKEEAHNLIKEMALNNKLDVDALTLLSANVEAMTQRLDCLNINVVSSSAPSPPCEICGSVDRLTINCQVGSLFA